MMPFLDFHYAADRLELTPLHLTISIFHHKKGRSPSIQFLIVQLLTTSLHPDCRTIRLQSQSTLATTRNCRWRGRQCFTKNSWFLVTHPCVCFTCRPLTLSKLFHCFKFHFRLTHGARYPRLRRAAKGSPVPGYRPVSGLRSEDHWRMVIRE